MEVQILMRSKKSTNKEGNKKKRWSRKVTEESHALDLESNVFTWNDPRKIAFSLKRSAEKSKMKKGTPYQSAMSMLNFYINRAGKDLPLQRKKILAETKSELRSIFQKD